MYEAWELRTDDVDLATCRQRGILVGGTNERHPAVDVFSFLGIAAAKLLIDAGVAVYTSSILLLCDNPFGPFIEHGLVSTGANVDMLKSLSAATGGRIYDAILVALKPRPEPVLFCGRCDHNCEWLARSRGRSVLGRYRSVCPLRCRCTCMACRGASARAYGHSIIRNAGVRAHCTTAGRRTQNRAIALEVAAGRGHAR